ncbi:MAG: UDP-N-acetyl-alpha-D-muramoyl-L-alanyl-L-glutamate epimerase [Micromonosporaceae bacterium]
MFRYTDLSFDEVSGVARFRYALDDLTFEEVVEFPPAPLTGDRRATFRRVLELLHIVAGTSYYKVAAPPLACSDTVALAAGARAYVRDLYTHGLAEFAYRNDLPHVLSLEPRFPEAPAPAPVRAEGAPLVCVGGGKDSIVSVEAVRRAGGEPVLFAVNPNWIIEGVVDASGLPSRYARRRIDPQLFELNKAGAYNGHIPVTAINSLIAVGTAVLHGFGPVVMSNERSASSPNTVWHGHEINHQWSKSEAAEAGLRDALAAHAGLSDGYFSLLRPFAELHIAKMYAPITRYDHAMTSCNRAYLLRGATARWCGDCPKCRFVFLALAPFVERDRLVDIFGKDMLADPAQLPGYLELVGLDGHKPFECVGEVEESLVAVELLRGDPAPVLAGIASAVPPGGWPSEEQARAAFTPAGRGLVPPAFHGVLDALG